MVKNINNIAMKTPTAKAKKNKTVEEVLPTNELGDGVGFIGVIKLLGRLSLTLILEVDDIPP